MRINRGGGEEWGLPSPRKACLDRAQEQQGLEHPWGRQLSPWLSWHSLCLGVGAGGRLSAGVDRWTAGRTPY